MSKSPIKILKYTLLLLFLTPSISFSAPNITGITGDLDSKTNMTINGTGFGVHADNGGGDYLSLLWEDIESGTADASHSDGSSRIHSSSCRNNSSYCAENHKWGTAHSYIDIWGVSRNTNNMIQVRHSEEPDDTIQEGFASAWIMFSQDYYDNLAREGEYNQEAPQTKFLGIVPPFSDYGGVPGPKTYFNTTYDPVTELIRVQTNTEVNGTRFVDYLSNLSPPGEWHRWDIYGDLTAVDQSNRTVQFFLDGKRLKYYTYESTNGRTIEHFDRWFAPLSQVTRTWTTEERDNYPQYSYFDDFYYDKTQARVEISDSSTWSVTSYAHKELQPILSWSSSQITVRLNFGSFEAGSTVYVYVIDDDGNVSASYEITLGEGVEPPTDSDPPTGGVTTELYGLSDSSVKTEFTYYDNTPPISVYGDVDPNSDSCSAQCGGDWVGNGSDMNWSAVTSWTISGLDPDECVCVDLTARDAVPNTGDASSVYTAYSLASTPGQLILGTQTDHTLTLNLNDSSNPSHTTFYVKIQICIPADPNWQDKYLTISGANIVPSDTPVYYTQAEWNGKVVGGGATVLKSNTLYGAFSVAKNGDGELTSAGTTGYGTTTGEEEQTPIYRIYNGEIVNGKEY